MNHTRFKDVKPNRIYVWICCFAINQFRVKEAVSSAVGNGIDAHELVKVFGSRVKTIGHVAMMMVPWESPIYLSKDLDACPGHSNPPSPTHPFRA